MGDWKRIETQNDIDALMRLVRGFHDTCLVSASFKTGQYVDASGAMALSYAPETYELTITLHSQWTKMPLELRFTGVHKASLTGYDQRDDGIIYDAHLAFHEDVPGTEGKRLIVWADWADFSPGKSDIDDLTSFVYAESLSWRETE